MNYSDYLPYAVAFVIAIPFLIYFRKFVYAYIQLKEKEIKLLSVNGLSTNHLQSYERMTLFLDRIKPSNLVSRFDNTLKPHEFVYLIEKTVSEEFEYNSAQQLYISKNVWHNIISSKNAIIQLAHTTYEELKSGANLEDFKTVFLMKYVSGNDYIAQTIEDLRKEALSNLNN